MKEKIKINEAEIKRQKDLNDEFNKNRIELINQKKSEEEKYKKLLDKNILYHIYIK